MKTVDIVLATYKPNEVYFKKLLQSLNNQTYSNLNLIVLDDSADNIVFERIKEIIDKEITAFGFKIFKNNKNLGSNKTFEKLTRNASANYIAYCDQDDIWNKDKITKLVDTIEKNNATLVYSDLSVIDKHDNRIADSFKDIQKRLKHLEGNGLFGFLLKRNSVTGCTMLIETEVAKSAIPFCHEFYVHDHWLSLFSSSIGTIAYVPEPLIQYRIHEDNQIGASMLSGIEDKRDYYAKKLLKEQSKYKFLLNNYSFSDNDRSTIKEVLSWTKERIVFFENRNLINTISMIRKIKDDYQLITFEIALNYLPNRMGRKVIRLMKKK